MSDFLKGISSFKIGEAATTLCNSPLNVHVNTSNNNLNGFFNPVESRPFLHNQDYHIVRFLHWKNTYPFPASYLASLSIPLVLRNCLLVWTYACVILCWRWKGSNYSASGIWQHWPHEFRSFIKDQNLASRKNMRRSHGCINTKQQSRMESLKKLQKNYLLAC